LEFHGEEEDYKDFVEQLKMVELENKNWFDDNTERSKEDNINSKE